MSQLPREAIDAGYIELLNTMDTPKKPASSNSRMTYAEHVVHLHATGQYEQVQENIRRREMELAKAGAALLKAEQPFVASMRAGGVELKHSGDLHNNSLRVEAFIPLLLEQARVESYHRRTRESIIRALGTRAALPYWDQLVDFFVNNSLNLAPEDRHWTAFALSEAADESKIDDLIRLITDTRFGVDRVPFIDPLLDSKSARARMTLMELCGDPTIGREIKRQRRIARLEKR